MALVTSSREDKLTSTIKIETSGLVTGIPQAKPQEQISQVQITNPTVKPIVIDQRYTPVDDIITHVEGASWVVDYYSQSINKDSELSGQQYNVNSVFQQYRKINQLQLKVTSALSTSQQEKSKAMEVGGTAFVMAGVIPNEGDMFTAGLGEGDLKAFRVTSSIKKSIFHNAIYEISYTLDNDYKAKLADLQNKVVEEFTYHEDMIQYGANPLLLTSQNNSYLELKKNYNDLLRYYFDKFFSKEFSTMILPVKGLVIYDPFLTKFLLSMFSTEEHHIIQKIKKPNVDDSVSLSSDSVLTAIMKHDPLVLNHCFKRSGAIGTEWFSFDPVFMTIKYSGIDRVVYPVDSNKTVDELTHYSYQIVGDASMTTTGNSEWLATVMDANELNRYPAHVVQGAYSIGYDDHYIFSKHFYTKSIKQSPFEAVVWRYISNSKIENSILLNMAKLVKTWGLVEQFYLLPILLVMIRGTMRTGGQMSNDDGYRYVNTTIATEPVELINILNGVVSMEGTEYDYADPIDTFMNAYRNNK